METLNNVANAASKAVFGGSETNKEPVSGVQGDTAKGEPYDAGNLDTDTQDKVEKRLSQDKTATDTTTATTTTTTATDTPVVSSDDKTKSDSDDTSDRPKPHASEVEDSTRAEPTGAGPRPLDTIAREHGGDAGAVDRPGEAGKTTAATGGDDKTADADKDESKKDDGKTAGQEVVHATGFAAEGGDFDASNPGAGKEADRLADSKAKGEPSEAATSGAAATTTTSSTSNNDGNDKDSSAKKHGKDKPSLSQRIKNKLHHRKE